MKKTGTADTANTRFVLLSALFGVFAAVLILSYSVYAWFTLSTEVVANGINLVATAPDNVLISLTGEDGTWAEAVTVTDTVILDNYNYDTDKELLIIPASSYAGFNGTFFQTNKSLPNGQPMPGVLFDVGTPLMAYRDHYEGYYVDIPLYFKTEGDEDIVLNLETDGLNESAITPTVDETNIYRTARLAFLNPAGTANSIGTNAPLVFASPDRSPLGGVITSSAVAGGSPVDPVFMTFDAEGYSTSSVLALAAADINDGVITTYPSQLILRIWIEGQDTYSTVAVSGQSFDINLKFAVKQPNV